MKHTRQPFWKTLNSSQPENALVIARDIQQAGAGLRSLAEPVLDTTGDFAELVLATLGVPPSWNDTAF